MYYYAITLPGFFIKDEYLEPMFSDLGQARSKARICKTVDC